MDSNLQPIEVCGQRDQQFRCSDNGMLKYIHVVIVVVIIVVVVVVKWEFHIYLTPVYK